MIWSLPIGVEWIEAVFPTFMPRDAMSLPIGVEWIEAPVWMFGFSDIVVSTHWGRVD